MPIKYLSEEPVKSGNATKLKFGHPEIVKALAEIVQDCKCPFTIGLFGKWGSGKSTLAENLKSTLYDKGIPLVIFDTWKHEGDALRRTFLVEIVQQLSNEPYGINYFPEFKLNDRLHGSVEQTGSLSYKINWNALRPLISQLALIASIPLVLSVLIGLFIFVLFENFFESYKSALTGIFSTLSITSILIWLVSNLKDYVNKSEIKISSDKFSDPHDFELEFKRILENLANSRIVIVFDNLDRVSGESALQIISTIKTFLEPVDKKIEKKDVVFLIPCDVVAIKRHIKKVINSEPENGIESDNYSEEFLRKFFNTTIWIPEFYTIELEEFAKEKLVETGVPEFNNDHLAWLITQVFRDNPRQIVQFINVLISNYLMLKHKSLSGSFGVNTNFYKENVPQLAKYLLLIQKFPTIMEKYKYSKAYDLGIDINDTDNLEFIEFRKLTHDILIPSLEPYFTFKLSRPEISLPGVSALIQMLVRSESEKAKIYAKDLLSSTERSSLFSSIIETYLSSKRNTVLLCSFLDNLFVITNQLSLRLNENTYREIQKKLGLSDVQKNLSIIGPASIQSEFFEKSEVRSDLKREIVNAWANILNESFGGRNLILSTEIEIDYLKVLSKNSFLLDGIPLQNLRSSILGKANDVNICIFLFGSSQAKELFVTHSFIEEFINQVSDNDFNSNIIVQKAQLLKDIGDSLVEEISSLHVFSKMNSLIVLGVSNLQIFDKVLDFVLTLGGVFYEKKLQIDTSSEWSEFEATLELTFSKTPIEARHFLFEFFYKFSSLDTKSRLSRTSILMNDYLSNLEKVDDDSIRYLSTRVNDQKFWESNINTIKSLVIKKPSLLGLLHHLFSEPSRLGLLETICIDENYDFILEVIDLLELEYHSKVRLTQISISQLKTVSGTHSLNTLIKIINKLNIESKDVDYDSLKATTLHYLKTLATQDSHGKVLLNGIRYFDESIRLNVVTNLFDSMTSDNRIASRVLLTVFRPLKDIFDEQLKGKYIIWIISKVILLARDERTIILGFESLGDVKFSFNQYIAHFDKIKERFSQARRPIDRIFRNSVEKGLRILAEKLKGTDSEGQFMVWVGKAFTI
jgi:GTPase SAR1 family protein